MRCIVSLCIDSITAAVIAGPAYDITAIGKGNNAWRSLILANTKSNIVLCTGKAAIVIYRPGNNIIVIATNLTVRRPGNYVAVVVTVYRWVDLVGRSSAVNHYFTGNGSTGAVKNTRNNSAAITVSIIAVPCNRYIAIGQAGDLRIVLRTVGIFVYLKIIGRWCAIGIKNTTVNTVGVLVIITITVPYHHKRTVRKSGNVGRIL